MQHKPIINTKTISSFTFLFFLIASFTLTAQTDTRIYDIIDAVSADRIKNDVKTLADFGTCNIKRV